jgi:inward rectifier potassium channel
MHKINLFALSWTVVHPITEESPLYKVSAKELMEKDAEFVVIFKAFDDTFAQTVHSRSSYKGNEIIWGAKFVPMFHTKENGNFYLEVDKLSQVVKADLN